MIDLNTFYTQICLGEYEDFLAQYNDDKSLIFARDDYGNTLLHYSVLDNNIVASKWLLDYGACAMIYNQEGINPIVLSAIYADPALLELILNRSKYSLTERNRAEIIGSAVVSGNYLCLDYLLKNGYDSNTLYRDDPIIYWAVQSNSVSIMELLCANGADVNLPNEEGMTALYDAAANGLFDICECLLKQGAEVDKTSIDHVSPLVIASCYNHTSIVKLLLDHGGNIESRNKKGETPLMMAIQYGCVDAVRILLLYGANSKAINKRGMSIEYYLNKIKNKSVRKEIQEMLTSSER